METTQMTPSFSSTFFDLTVFNILVCNILVSNILNLKILKIHFDVVVHLQTAHHTFLERRHSEVTKNPYYVLSTSRSQIPIFFKIQLMDYSAYKKKKRLWTLGMVHYVVH